MSSASSEGAARVLFIFGTRPEAIKLAPVISTMRSRPSEFRVSVCVTSQHREMLDQALPVFGIQPDFDLDLMRPDQTLSDLTARILHALPPVLRQLQPDWAIVQGDTTTTLSAALCAFYHRVPVAHIEAGLRTGHLDAQFPEELNRRAVDLFAGLCFAPTERAAECLRSEGVAEERIHVTGNTGIDAILKAVEFPCELRSGPLAELDDERELVLVTTHRRESFGAPLQDICRGIREIAARHAKRVQFVLPVHPNPNVAEPIRSELGAIQNVLLVEPIDYVPFAHLIARARIVLTDSGGIQEEAASLGKPVLVMRERMERPEGIDAGCATLVGRDPARIASAVDQLLTDPAAYEKMAVPTLVYGDGRASERICDAITCAHRRATG